jgi:hypothetical protein
VDAHRTALTEAANHFAALATATAGAPSSSANAGGPKAQPAGAEASVAGELLAKEALASAFVDLGAWLAARLAAEVAAVEDGSTLGSLHQQLLYSARRSGRIGANWEGVAGPLLQARAAESAVQAMATARRRFASAIRDLSHSSSGAHSEAGLRGHAASAWAELTNATTGAVNACRTVWTAELQADLGAALRHHVDAVVADAEAALADSPNAPLLDACTVGLDSFITSALGIAEIV